MDRPAVIARKPFWARQFSETATSYQIIFDVLFGAVIPILLLIFDPVVFRDTGACTGSLLANDAIFAYVAVALGIVTLLVWLFVGEFRRGAAAFVAGILLTGAFLAAGVGIVMLPVTFIGLIVCIGILGLIPFLTAFVYLRNGVRAMRAAAVGIDSPARLFASLLAGSIMVLGIPFIVQTQSGHTIQTSANQVVSSCNNSSSD